MAIHHAVNRSLLKMNYNIVRVLQCPHLYTFVFHQNHPINIYKINLTFLNQLWIMERWRLNLFFLPTPKLVTTAKTSYSDPCSTSHTINNHCTRWIIFKKLQNLNMRIESRALIFPFNLYLTRCTYDIFCVNKDPLQSELPPSYSHVVPQKLAPNQKGEKCCCNYYKWSQESFLNGVARLYLTAAFIEQTQSL